MKGRKSMRITKILAAVSAAAVLFSAAPTVQAANEEQYYRITMLDFDGNEMGHLNVKAGQSSVSTLLSRVDTSALHTYIGTNTEMGFNSWSSYPETITGDITVQALYRKLTISLDAMPEITEYYDKYGKIDLKGLKVTITSEIQLPEKEEDGTYKISKSITDISSACTAEPDTLQSAFAGGNSCHVNVYPISTEKAIASYDITYFPDIGDADMDGMISSADASYVLSVYSDMATGKSVTFAPTQKKRMDVDSNGRVEPSDASLILAFYADAAVKEHPSWMELLDNAG